VDEGGGHQEVLNKTTGGQKLELREEGCEVKARSEESRNKVQPAVREQKPKLREEDCEVKN
jgi:hypothetical protein